MNKKVNLIAAIIVMLACVSSITFAESKDEIRGVWVATVKHLDYPQNPTTSSSELKAYADKILDSAYRLGFNRIYLQVRPTADAIYPSDIFPYSKYLTGTQGQAPDDNFDALQYWVDGAHARGLKIEAWINPYRITKREPKDPEPTVEELAPNHPARLHPEWVIKHGIGDLYFDPAIPQVRALIVSGVNEIINNYDVDGIHFDDYFYPSVDFKDDASYASLGEGINKDDWRRANVNALVKDVYTSCHQRPQPVEFGISPFGIWANAKDKDGGSDTAGNSSYFMHYADSLYWIDQGIIDYIIPQIYWNIGYDIADYDTLVKWWHNNTKDTNTKLIVGHAAYKLGSSSKDSPWNGSDELFRQLKLNQTLGINSSVFFRINDFIEDDALFYRLQFYYDFIDLQKMLKSQGIVFNPTAPNYFGAVVENKRWQKMTAGILDMSFAQTTKSKKTKNLLYVTALPKNTTYCRLGDELSLQIEAPIGAKVSATVSGQTFTLKPTDKFAINSNHAVYASTFVLPDNYDSSTNNTIYPLYQITYQNKSYSTASSGAFTILDNLSNYYAIVNKTYADTYFETMGKDGPAYELSQNMVDKITNFNNGFFELSTGRFIKTQDVDVVRAENAYNNQVLSSEYLMYSDYDMINFELTDPVAVYADVIDNTLIINFTNTAELAPLNAYNQDLYQNVSQTAELNGAQYKLELKNINDLAGYYIKNTKNGVSLYIKKTKKINDQNLPLKEFTIIIDPGHGGVDAGAVGLGGDEYAEKHIVLEMAFKIEQALNKYGAKVILTRCDDVFVPVKDRYKISRSIDPDAFISLHINSYGDDITTASGFQTHYIRNIASSLAANINKSVAELTSIGTRGLLEDNFYVVRATWTPSILIEMGFIKNQSDYAFLSNQDKQTELANAIAKGIVDNFRR